MSLKDIIKQPEGRRLEFKEAIPTKAELGKTIVAFSNDAGGVLYLGVRDEPREVVGIPEDDLMSVEEQVSNIIHDNCNPVIIPNISSVVFEDKYLLKVEIFRGSNLPYYLKTAGKKEGTFIRVGSSNRKATDEIIAELERQKRNTSFDAELIFDKPLDEINIESFTAFYEEKTDEKLEKNTLKKLQLINTYQDEEKATQALVLFSDDPLRNEMFPYAKIECARFKGTTTDEFIDQKTIDSNIALQAEAAYDFVLRHINKGATVKGVYTETRWEYPVIAIREAIRNAIVHRDYSLSGKDIKVAIYDDMIEITSPGTLLPSIDFTEMESRQSDIRNKVIAPIFKRLGIIDQWGNGLKLIAKDLKEYPEIGFEWFEKGLQFQVQFIKKNYIAPKEDKGFGFLVDEYNLDINEIEDNIGERALVILKIVSENSKVTLAELAEIIGVAERTINRDIKELTDKKYLDREGSRKTGDWIIVKQE
ncbi:RNA-binding domain-containing protein [Gelidibacter gilvus]|uniref:HTH domain-containing protein n=1 Tax=Gelidibacter gilvus TaxID=59602 RepID=A0A4Q0XHU4_9FLAO|nr:RNA-binding domain-containing protein [Gelidibacter gilvus]RXJ50433.1 HTH domain-containing protein [Gelidibacter gilvus]